MCQPLYSTFGSAHVAGVEHKLIDTFVLYLILNTKRTAWLSRRLHGASMRHRGSASRGIPVFIPMDSTRILSNKTRLVAPFYD
jgi:hypothetical protein